ncbi:Uncharacterised protein [Mycobacteroides abscessus subsp. abscessus]|nr:Uncharacterised protein [Mycobacteroides abscessus subsp. abscessus]
MIGGGIGASEGSAVPGTRGAGPVHQGKGGLGSIRLGVGLISGGPTATRFPLGPRTVPGGGDKFGGG